MQLQNRKRKIELIIVCVDNDKERFSDLLKITFLDNVKHFEHTIVVTDKQTKNISDICNFPGVSIIRTNAFYYNGAQFNKGMGIDLALKFSKYKDFILLLDADILLPKDFLKRLESNLISIDKMYGVNRICVETKEQYNFIIKQDWPSMMGNNTDWGWGYFQFFNLNSCFLKDEKIKYPSYKDRTLCDFFFRMRFGGTKNFQDQNSIWHWNENFQRRLNFSVLHLDKSIV